MSSHFLNDTPQSSSILPTLVTKLRCKSLSNIPYRYKISILLCTGGIAYILMYISFKEALQHMKEPEPYTNLSYSGQCKFARNVSKVTYVKPSFHLWAPSDYLNLELAPSCGVLVTAFPSGYFADMYGGKYFVWIPVILLGLVEAIIPPILSGGDMDYYILMFWQFLSGVGLAMFYSGANSILAQWTPVEERARLASIAYCASQFAVVFHYGTTSNFILATKMWNAPFYLYIALGLIWVVCFAFFGFSHYQSKKNKWLHEEELQFLTRKLENMTAFRRKKFPWLKFFTSFALWAVVVAHFGFNWMWKVMLTNLHPYLRHALYFDYQTTDGLYFLTNRKYVHLMTLRKLYTTIGLMGPITFLLSSSYAGCHWESAIVLITIGMILMSFYFSGTRINTLEFAPNFSASVMGMMNTFDITPVIGVPKLAAIIRPHNTLPEKKLMFWVYVGMVAFCTLTFTFIGSTETQSWNGDDHEEEEIEMENSSMTPRNQYMDPRVT
ncbi:sialin-like isoform X2 [Zophobas morio]|uniref:sialin-like isoform X2 n=1 Tax=Zophobas morio TaxID=2755281 RepID=UPI003083D4DD